MENNMKKILALSLFAITAANASNFDKLMESTSKKLSERMERMSLAERSEESSPEREIEKSFHYKQKKNPQDERFEQKINQIRHKKHELYSLKKQAEETENVATTTTEKLNRLVDELEQAQMMLNNEKARNTKLERLLESEKEQKVRIEKKFNVLCQETGEEIASLNSELKKLTKTNKTLSLSLQKLESEKHEIETRSTQVIDRLNSEADKNIEMITGLELMVKELKKEKKELLTTTDRLEAEVDHLNRQVRVLDELNLSKQTVNEDESFYAEGNQFLEEMGRSKFNKRN